MARVVLTPVVVSPWQPVELAHQTPEDDTPEEIAMTTMYTNSGGEVVELSVDDQRVADRLASHQTWATQRAAAHAVFGYDPDSPEYVDTPPDLDVVPAPDVHAPYRTRRVADYHRENLQMRAPGNAGLDSNNRSSEALGNAGGQVVQVGGHHRNGQPVRGRHDPLESPAAAAARLGLDPDGSGVVYAGNPHSFESRALADLYARQYGLGDQTPRAGS